MARSGNGSALVGFAVLFAILAAACAPERDPLAGTYSVQGGGAALDIFNALKQEFVKRHPGVNMDFQDIGSTPGMKLVASGSIDLATSSSDPPASIRDAVRLVPLGVSGTAVVVNSQNPLIALTRDQVRDIFSGDITDWATVGGTPSRIFVAVRNPKSAIRTNFEAYVFAGTTPRYARDAFELNDIDQTIDAVSSRAGVISMITINDRSLGDPHLRLITLDGVRATKDTLATGEYPMRRPLYLVYPASGVKPAIQAFLDFVRSPDGQRIIASTSSG
jgi:phosphate transport system substrate-binding protein